jgi:hypothetical protein
VRLSVFNTVPGPAVVKLEIEGVLLRKQLLKKSGRRVLLQQLFWILNTLPALFELLVQSFPLTYLFGRCRFGRWSL